MRKMWIVSAVVLGACGTHPAPGTVDMQNDRVSIGYGDQSRSQIAGAVTSVTPSERDRRTFSRMEDLLRARIPGAQIVRAANGDFSIRFRGPSTLLGSNDALIVVDGVPLMAGGGLGSTGLRPGDIARIDVLRDAGSAAIYGVRGANGVVLIKTRRGR